MDTVQAKQHARSRSTRALSQTALHVTIVVLLLLSLIPFYLMIQLSFKTPLQYRYERWLPAFPLRVSNYLSAWNIIDSYIWTTLLVAFLGLAGVLVLSMIGGYVFARMSFPFREWLYYAIVALLMVPGVLSFIPSYMLYFDFGLMNTLWVLIIPNIAGGQVFGIFLMRSVIAGIPEELFESARCDGASVWTLIWKIAFPLCVPGLATLSVLNFLGTWNSFLWPLLTIRGERNQVIAVGLFKLSRTVQGGIDFGVWGPLYAGYVIASLPLIFIFIFLGRFYVEGLVGSGLKA